MVYINIVMVMYMKVIIKKVISMEKVYINMQMEIYIMENIKKI